MVKTATERTQIYNILSICVRNFSENCAFCKLCAAIGVSMQRIETPLAQSQRKSNIELAQTYFKKNGRTELRSIRPLIFN